MAPIAGLILDFDSWTEYNVYGEAMEPMDSDFNKDLEEAKMPTAWPDGAPESDLDEDEDDEDDEDDDYEKPH